MLKSKSIVIILFLVGAVVAKKNQTQGNGNQTRRDSYIENTKGCENATIIKNLKAKACCPSLPDFFTKDLWKNCSATGQREDDCAKYACVLKASKITDKTGKFDANIAIATLNAAVKNDPLWPMGSMVDKCVAEAPSDVKAWQQKMAAMNRTTPACPNAENFAIVKCLRRSLILSCPNWMETRNCGILMKYAQSCPLYPFREDQVQKGKAKAVGGKKVKKV